MCSYKVSLLIIRKEVVVGDFEKEVVIGDINKGLGVVKRVGSWVGVEGIGRVKEFGG